MDGITRDDAKLMVGAGWSGLIDEVYNRLPPDAFVSTIKEKWGGLRCYVFKINMDVLDFLDEIEERSYTVCECCGKSGKLRTGGWWKTLCEKCARENKYIE